MEYVTKKVCYEAEFHEVSTFKGDNHIIKGNDIAFSNTIKQFLHYSTSSFIQLQNSKQASIPGNPVIQSTPNFCIHVNIG